MQEIVSLLPLVGIALLVWLLLVRPQARRRRELVHLQSTLEVGDEVMLTSGVYGTVSDLDDEVATIEVATGVAIRVARGAIAQVVRETGAPERDDVSEVSEEN